MCVLGLKYSLIWYSVACKNVVNWVFWLNSNWYMPHILSCPHHAQTECCLICILQHRKTAASSNKLSVHRKVTNLLGTLTSFYLPSGATSHNLFSLSFALELIVVAFAVTISRCCARGSVLWWLCGSCKVECGYVHGCETIAGDVTDLNLD